MQMLRFESTAARLKLCERAFALPMILFFALLIFIFISSLWFITSQESDQSMKYVLKIKGEGISEAIHTFLLSECYSYSWDNRFYSSEVEFSMSNPSGVEPVKRMVESTNRMIKNDKIMNGLVTYSGKIKSYFSSADGLRIIWISVYVERPAGLKSEIVCAHDYFDLYKRDLLDSLGETIGIFYDQEKKDKNDTGIPPEVAACFKKSNEGIISSINYDKKNISTDTLK